MGTGAGTGTSRTIQPQLMMMPDPERAAGPAVTEQRRSSDFSSTRGEGSAYSSMMPNGPEGIVRRRSCICKKHAWLS